MTSKTASAIYLEKAMSYTASRWVDINMANLADAVPKEEILYLMKKCREIALIKSQRQLDHLMTLDAPACILDGQRQALERAKTGKANIEAILRRSINRRN